MYCRPAIIKSNNKREMYSLEVYPKNIPQTQKFEQKHDLTILYFPDSEPKESLAVAPTS